MPRRGPGRRRDAGRDVQGGGRARAGEPVAEVATLADVPDGSRPLSAREQRAGDLAHGRGRAPRGDAVEPRRRSRSCAAPRTGTISTRCRVAFAAIAETGTLALVSGADNPTTLNFLPDNHIVVVRRDDIVADYESVFPRLRARLRQGRRAAHGQFHHRPIALGRHRADPAPRRARAAAPAHRDRRVSARRGLGRAAAAARKPLCEFRNHRMAYAAQRRPLRSGALSCGRFLVR